MDLATVSSYRPAPDRASLALAPGETYVAGGTWLFSEPQPDVSGLVDLTALGWPAVETLPDGGRRIAATCTVAELRAHDWPAPLAPLVGACADALLMSWKVQRAATVGGNLCLALAAGAMVSLTDALDGTVEVWTPSGGTRTEPVRTFVRGPGATTLAPGEVVRAVRVPPPAEGDRWAFRRIALTALGRSAAVVIGRRSGDALRLSVTASTPRPRALDLSAAASERDVRTAVASLTPWYDDPHGAPDWRAAVTAELAVQVVEELVR